MIQHVENGEGSNTKALAYEKKGDVKYDSDALFRPSSAFYLPGMAESSPYDLVRI